MGCQTHTWHPLSRQAAELSRQQKIVHNLLLQGKLYDHQDRKLQKTECRKLKKRYQQKADWQTGWLLVYSFNRNHKCLSLQKKIDIIRKINSAENPSNELLWLNNNHLNLLSELNDLKRLQQKNINLRTQLKRTQKELKKENSKIKALKEIETSINKKLGNE